MATVQLPSLLLVGLPLLLLLLPAAWAAPSSERLLLQSSNGSATTQVLQLLVAADSSFINKAGGEAKAAARVAEIVDLANALCRRLGLAVVLQHLLLWPVDPVPAFGSAVETFTHFAAYKAANVSLQHDLGLRLSGKAWDNGRLGFSFRRGLCHRIRSTGLVADDQPSASLAAWVMTRVIAKSVGISGRSSRKCICPSPYGCVFDPIINMNPSIEKMGWSSCSVASWRSGMSKTWRSCLRQSPGQRSGGSGSRCGNGVVEIGEQCDCGPEISCSSSCCHAPSCQLKPGAACASGSCCNRTTCQLLQQGSQCRAAEGSCDVQETCDGVSEWCPADDKVADGVECVQGQAHCYSGQCRSRSGQCQRLFSPSAAEADGICYSRLNTRGRVFGYCHIRLYSVFIINSTNLWHPHNYTHCSHRDSMCGLLHCQQPSPLPPKLKKVTSTYTVSGHTCSSRPLVDFSSSGVRSPSLAPDGAACGFGRMCVNSSCQRVPSVGSCNGNGVPISSGGCFCNRGFAPPKCDTDGCGGSVTSPLPCPGGRSLTSTLVAVACAAAFVIFLALLLLLVVSRRCGLVGGSARWRVDDVNVELSWDSY